MRGARGESTHSTAEQQHYILYLLLPAAPRWAHHTSILVCHRCQKKRTHLGLPRAHGAGGPRTSFLAAPGRDDSYSSNEVTRRDAMLAARCCPVDARAPPSPPAGRRRLSTTPRTQPPRRADFREIGERECECESRPATTTTRRTFLALPAALRAGRNTLDVTPSVEILGASRGFRRWWPLCSLASGTGAAAAEDVTEGVTASASRSATRPTPRDLGDGVRGVDLVPGTPGGAVACPGATVRVLLKGRLFAKQGWIFTDDYAEAARDGLPAPRTFTLGAHEVIEGLEIGTVGMTEGGVRRIVIPPALSYQDRTQEPVPRDFANRQRLYTTIFNPTRLANGEGDTLSTVIFDVELVRVVGGGGRDEGGGEVAPEPR